MRYDAMQVRLKGLVELAGGVTGLDEEMARCAALNPNQTELLQVIRPDGTR
jgi:hypothetical protein